MLMSDIYKDDYTDEQVREYLSNKGYSYDSFIEWMRGQTVGVSNEGKVVYYKSDVERYRE